MATHPLNSAFHHELLYFALREFVLNGQNYRDPHVSSKKPISKELLFSKWMCYSSTYFNSLPATITSHTPSRVYHVYLNCKNTSKRRGIQRALTTFRESLHGKFHELFVTNDAKDMYLKITEDIAHWFGRCQSRVLSLHLHRKALANKGKHNTIGCKRSRAVSNKENNSKDADTNPRKKPKISTL
eukprot:915486_1